MKDKDPFEHEPFIFRWPVLRWWWAMWLAIAVLMAAGTVRILRPQMDERLYARYRKLPQASFLLSDSACCPGLNVASALFNQKKYTRAIEQFKKDTSIVYADEVRLFTGICALELNRMQEAEQTLLPLLGKGNGPGSEAVWYTAISRLRRHDRKGCVALLKEIPPTAPRFPLAQALLAHHALN